MHTGFWGGNLREQCHLQDLGTDVRLKLKWILHKQDRKEWTGLIWLRLGPSSRLLSIQ
jgi:hypothetical protein